MPDFETLDYAVKDRVAEITMRRAPVNAINHALIEDILAAYARARDDDGVRAVILTSAFEAAFSAGMDLAMIRGGTGMDLRRFLEKLYFGMHDMQYRMGKPTIAALPGPARAAGVTLAVSCDVLIGCERTSIGYPEIDVGVIPAMHFVHLPRQIGRHKAFELLFGGKPISADEAERRGILNKVVPQADVMTEARAMAAEFASKSPVVMRLARDAFMRANDFEYRRAIENTVETICNIIATEDAQEGLNAFNEKRKPNW
jgi:enoyl-CoA hydratase/carnithine racemase